ncbi:MAG: OmpH family outer membrane protein [Muribaculaceae bacterium]|jgi:outer membrane protein|nr:OmpH family outer membrane protein [Muribaculaceae bacterium]
MKIVMKLVSFVIAFASVAMFTSCSESKKAEATADATEVVNEEPQMVIRYIDEDSLLAQYNLAKDINEAMLRRSNQFDNEQQRRARDIQKLASDIESKYKNNGYLTQESFNADQNKLAKMQSDAENYMARLQRDIQNEMVQNQIQLNDSINNFMKAYCQEKGFNAVLRKTASFYIDAKYDVTAEVVEGLNKRYNKVVKK